MRFISAKEYSELTGISLGHVYEQMRTGKLDWKPFEKVVKRIPWDDTKREAVKLK